MASHLTTQKFSVFMLNRGAEQWKTSLDDRAQHRRHHFKPLQPTTATVSVTACCPYWPHNRACCPSWWLVTRSHCHSFAVRWTINYITTSKEEGVEAAFEPRCHGSGLYPIALGKAEGRGWWIWRNLLKTKIKAPQIQVHLCQSSLLFLLLLLNRLSAEDVLLVTAYWRVPAALHY